MGTDVIAMGWDGDRLKGLGWRQNFVPCLFIMTY